MIQEQQEKEQLVQKQLEVEQKMNMHAAQLAQAFRKYLVRKENSEHVSQDLSDKEVEAMMTHKALQFMSESARTKRKVEDLVSALGSDKAFVKKCESMQEHDWASLAQEQMRLNCVIYKLFRDHSHDTL